MDLFRREGLCSKTGKQTNYANGLGGGNQG
jgi:hypothetical protein